MSELVEDATPAGPLPRDPRPATTPYAPPAAFTIRLGGRDRRVLLHAVYDCREQGTAVDIADPRRPGEYRRYQVTTSSARPGWLPAGQDAQPAPASEAKPATDRRTWPDSGDQPALWIRLADQWCDARLRGRERRANGRVVYRMAYLPPGEHRRGVYLYGVFYWHPHSVVRQRGLWELGPDLELPDAPPVAGGPVPSGGLRWWRVRPARPGQPPVLHRGDCGDAAALPTLTRQEAVLLLNDDATGTVPCPRCRPDLGLAES